MCLNRNFFPPISGRFTCWEKSCMPKYWIIRWQCNINIDFQKQFWSRCANDVFYSRFRCYVNLIAWRRPWITKDWKLNFWMKTAFPGKLESVILSGWWVHSIPFVGEKSLSDFCWSWPPSLALPSSLFRPRICRLNSSWENR